MDSFLLLLCAAEREQAAAFYFNVMKVHIAGVNLSQLNFVIKKASDRPTRPIGKRRERGEKCNSPANGNDITRSVFSVLVPNTNNEHPFEGNTATRRRRKKAVYRMAASRGRRRTVSVGASHTTTCKYCKHLRFVTIHTMNEKKLINFCVAAVCVCRCRGCYSCILSFFIRPSSMKLIFICTVVISATIHSMQHTFSGSSPMVCRSGGELFLVAR